jgi:hypothetical protein
MPSAFFPVTWLGKAGELSMAEGEVVLVVLVAAGAGRVSAVR